MLHDQVVIMRSVRNSYMYINRSSGAFTAGDTYLDLNFKSISRPVVFRLVRRIFALGRGM